MDQQSKHQEYLINRFPALAAEFALIPDEQFRDNFGFNLAYWDAIPDADVIFYIFNWGTTPQGAMFWSDIYVQMVRK